MNLLFLAGTLTLMFVGGLLLSKPKRSKKKRVEK